VNVHQNGYYYLLLIGQEQNNIMMLQINWFLLKLLKNSINGLQQNIKMHSFYVDIRYHILLLIKHCYQKLVRNDKWKNVELLINHFVLILILNVQSMDLKLCFLMGKYQFKQLISIQNKIKCL
jgi:hypothetical protein